MDILCLTIINRKNTLFNIAIYSLLKPLEQTGLQENNKDCSPIFENTVEIEVKRMWEYIKS